MKKILLFIFLNLLFIISCKNAEADLFPEAKFTTPIIEFGKVTFRNYSLNATEYFWEFDDGTTSTEVEPTHDYTQAGTYNVKLTASDGVNSNAYFLIVAIGQIYPSNLTQLDPLPFGKLAKMVSFTYNGKGYVGGGLLTNQFQFPNILWEFDPSTNIWTEVSYDWPSSAGGLLLRIDDVFYAGLGEVPGISNNTLKKSVYEYNPQSGIVSSHSELPINFNNNYDHLEVTASFSYDGKGYVIGQNPFEALGSINKKIWEFTPDDSNPWKLLGDYPTEGNYGMFHFQFDEKVIIGMGNTNSYSSFQNSQEIWEYNIATNVWTQKNDFPINARRSGISFIYNGEGYVGFGQSANFTTGVAEQNSDIWKYNVTNDSWEKIIDLPILNNNKMFSFVLGNTLYIGGGYSSVGGGVDDFYKYEF